MDYYEPNRPPVDDSGLTGGVGFNFNGQIATQSYKNSYVSGGGGGGAAVGGKTADISVCIDGVQTTLTVYIA